MARNEFLTALASTPTDKPISPSDVAKALATPPFVNVPGAFNTRDLSHPPHLRQGLIYRSGVPKNLTTEGKALLSNTLHIKTIFDMRSPKEQTQTPIGNLEHDYGIKVVSLSWDTVPSTLDITDYISDPLNTDIWNGGAKGYSKQYFEVLSVYKTAYRTVLTHLLKTPNSPILFNCHAGKDRTGVLAALILSLAGVPDADIAYDYSLTRIGFEPERESLIAFIKKWKPELTEDTPGMREFSAVREEYMVRFLKDAREVYGGDEGEGWAEGYVKRELGFSGEEVDMLKENLRGASS
ncbi:hypothetical protein H2200_006218 [Cladophialophora chaetospira]|uniref:Tyrosine specific protein phosphatases domain-containing protein n=1 Tax=Cladophialophora chaetospira TaxID=386627 RepID=A0AA38XAI2_9EURO|nr:hypothetical protein H2200_006218 [Cladophialophora chaetospira]